MRPFGEQTLGARRLVLSWTRVVCTFEVSIQYVSLLLDFNRLRSIESLAVQGEALYSFAALIAYADSSAYDLHPRYTG